jgi:hypothetical protein
MSECDEQKKRRKKKKIVNDKQPRKNIMRHKIKRTTISEIGHE